MAKLSDQSGRKCEGNRLGKDCPLRILVVESDPKLESILETVLKDYKDREKAVDRASALNAFEDSLASHRPFDLVVIDIAPPDMQDVSIIQDIRQIETKHNIPEHEKAYLVGISASAGRQLVTDCMVCGCDEFIDKPFDPDQFTSLLTRYEQSTIQAEQDPPTDDEVTGRVLFDRVIKKIDRGDLALPPAPKIAMRTRQLVDLNADIEEVVKLLKHDISISTKLISISNSVAYGGFDKNTSTSQAVRRLGIDRSVEVVMSICCRGYFATNHPGYKQLVEDLWWHSLACAHAIKMVIDHKAMKIEEDSFTLGLLHDIGKLILIQAASNMQIPKKYRMEIGPEALQAIHDQYHGQVGMRILVKWGYSKSFAALIQHHRVNPQDNPPAAMQALHEADLLATIAGFGYGKTNPTEASNQLEPLGYPSRRQDDFNAELRSQVEQLRYAFG
jgi:HD-like signal output (HDOD) protein/CheY-like chemotaxis protein